ncbi:NAD(P)H-dependent glycerol-3-phosphate dehydrogenase [Desulfurivibrio sp. D14AmB]|uniref:NAD(P)H-dependent glycerol-3-phosphate dehydrogenase n=1 Tax=Desulfurivibrio sp. D14AmB TaxID=3374370 RepID=UPI00376EAE04
MSEKGDPGRVAVIGAGSWGTALAGVLARKGYRVPLWSHTPARVEEMSRERENRAYLPGFPLLENIEPGSDPALVRGCEAVVMAVPSHGFRAVFKRIVPHLEPGSAIISAAKGIENDSLLTMTGVMAEELALAQRPELKCRLGVLAGPSFAREVAEGLPTAVTVAAADQEIARYFQQLFFTQRFRVYAGTDLIGQELGGALKNIIAIAAGISDGLGYGTNSRAALITRGLAEITRLGVKMGAQPLTFSGLAGLGDLVLTCTGDLSRNRTVGLKLGRGMKIGEILAEMRMVAEGVKTTSSARALARRMGVEMPILEEVYLVLYEDKSCREAVRDLLAREGKEELG